MDKRTSNDLPDFKLELEPLVDISNLFGRNYIGCFRIELEFPSPIEDCFSDVEGSYLKMSLKDVYAISYEEIYKYCNGNQEEISKYKTISLIQPKALNF